MRLVAPVVGIESEIRRDEQLARDPEWSGFDHPFHGHVGVLQIPLVLAFPPAVALDLIDTALLRQRIAVLVRGADMLHET
jgi:hypothetical protein